MPKKPGPKPKEEQKRQVLNTSVMPWVFKELDSIVHQFGEIQKFLPDWYRCPDSRSSAAAWILERCIQREGMKIEAILRSHWEDIYPVSTPDDFAPSKAILNEIAQDPFLSALQRSLQDAASRINEGSMLYPEQMPAPQTQPSSGIGDEIDSKN